MYDIPDSKLSIKNIIQEFDASPPSPNDKKKNVKFAKDFLRDNAPDLLPSKESIKILKQRDNNNKTTL